LQYETTVGICTPDKLPIAPYLIVILQTSIARNTTVPTQNLLSAVNSLLSANSSHVNALANKETSAASVIAAEAKLKELTTPTADAIRNASNAVQAAQAAYDSTKAKADALATPAELDLLTQQQAVRTAEIALQTAQDALDDTTLVAPFSGKAGAVAAVVGQRIGSGASAVVLSNPDAIRLDLTISEADLVNIKAGMLGLARFDSMPRNAYVVKVIGVSTIPTVTQGVVTYPVQAAILRGNALNDIRDQLPSLTRALSSGASGAQFSAILGGAGGGRPGGAAGASGAQGARPQGASGASGATGASAAQGQRPQGASGASGAAGASGATGGGSGASGPRGASGASGATGAGGPGGGGGIAALLNPPLPAAGMNASITLLVSVTENQLLLPTGAVRRQGNQQFVYQPNPTAGGAPVQKPVTTAGTDGTNIAIASGLAEGDTVLLGAIGTATPAPSKTTGGTTGGVAVGPGGAPGGGGPGGVGGIR
ncbi:MAG: HlyD family efflux transporter periplasmic adaptor subunit, partial [Actinomycetota bacterium]